MCITIKKTKRGTRIQATGADAQAFFERMTRPAAAKVFAFSPTALAFDDLTAAAHRQRLGYPAAATQPAL